MRGVPPPPVLARRAAALVACVFGLLTLFAGGSVLLGADPGYVVFRPLLVYNTAMGLAYVAAGIALWREGDAGRRAAAAIFALNLAVLAGICLVFVTGGGVATDSLAAMTLRTVVWLGLFLVARRFGREGRPQG